MLDITLLRKDLAFAIARLEARKQPQTFLKVEAFQALETERKALQIKTEELQNQRNTLSKQVGQLKSKGEDASLVMAQVSASKAELEASASRLDQIQADMQALLLAVPNLPHESVPLGSDEHGNLEVRKWSPAEGLGGAAVACLGERPLGVAAVAPLGGGVARPADLREGVGRAGSDQEAESEGEHAERGGEAFHGKTP